MCQQKYQLLKPYEISCENINLCFQRFLLFLLDGVNPDDDETIYELISTTPSESFIAKEKILGGTIEINKQHEIIK